MAAGSPACSPSGRPPSCLIARARSCAASSRRSGRIEVTVPRQIRARRGITPYVCTDLTAADRTLVDAIPCASVPLTLLGLAATDASALPGALATAEKRGVLDLAAIDELLARRSRTPGGPALRAALGAYRSGGRGPGASSSAVSWASVSTPACRGRGSTRGSRSPATVSRWTSHGRSHASSSRPTATRATGIGTFSRRTAGAISSSWRPGGGSCASRGGRSSTTARRLPGSCAACCLRRARAPSAGPRRGPC